MTDSTDIEPSEPSEPSPEPIPLRHRVAATLAIGLIALVVIAPAVLAALGLLFCLLAAGGGLALQGLRFGSSSFEVACAFALVPVLLLALPLTRLAGRAVASLWRRAISSSFFAGMVSAWSLIIGATGLLLVLGLGLALEGFDALGSAHASAPLPSYAPPATSISDLGLRGAEVAPSARPRSEVSLTQILGASAAPAFEEWSFNRCIEELHQAGPEGYSLKRRAIEREQSRLGRASAEDVVQNAMIAVCLRPERPWDLPSYFFRTVRNTGINEAARYRRCPLFPEPVELPFSPGFDEQYLHREALEVTHRVLCSLGERKREVLLLHAVEGLPHDEIADRFGQSGEAIRQTYSRAQRTLANRFYQQYQ